MSEVDTKQEVAAPTHPGQPRVYAPWMIGVLVVFLVCNGFLLVCVGGNALFLIGAGLVFAALFYALRCCRVYGGTCLASLVAALVLVYIAVGLLVPAGCEPARRYTCMSNLKQIGIALLNHESAKGKLPPAFVADEQGRKMHSWRTLILPYMEGEQLHKKYDFQQPWDSPENRKLVAESPIRGFQCPSYPHPCEESDPRTDYVAVLGEDTLWAKDGTPRSLKDLKVDPSNVAVLIEINDSDIWWSEPRDVMLEDFLSGKRSWRGTAMHDGSVRNILFADGRVHGWQGDMTPDQIRRLFSITEPFDIETEEPPPFEPRSFAFCDVVFCVWLATFAMQFLYIFFPVKRKPMPEAST